MTAATTLCPADFGFFADFLRSRSAISLAAGKEYLVESRLAPLVARTGHQGIAELIDSLRSPAVDPQVSELVVEAMTTNETSFFRDVPSFEAFRSEVLPTVVTQKSAARRLSIWSAASSTGQELYSIAMTIADLFPQVLTWDLTLHGTDLSTEALSKARAARFTPLEVNRGLPAQLLVKYFRRDGRNYAIDETLRSRCRFERMNLAEPWPVLPRFDIVFCRNVLIYFDLPVRERIIARIRSVLNPGGYLFLGPAEATPSVMQDFKQIRVGATIVYQLEGKSS